MTRGDVLPLSFVASAGSKRKGRKQADLQVRKRPDVLGGSRVEKRLGASAPMATVEPKHLARVVVPHCVNALVGVRVLDLTNSQDLCGVPEHVGWVPAVVVWNEPTQTVVAIWTTITANHRQSPTVTDNHRQSPTAKQQGKSTM
jgi:hypothetical protein